MVRKTISVVVGLVATFLVMMSFEFTNSLLYPFPSGFDTSNALQIKGFIETNSPNIFFLVVAGWISGSLVGGIVIAKISKSRSPVSSIVAGFILTMLQLLNFQFLPHPMWAMAIGITAMIPFCFLGHLLARRSEVSVSGFNG